MVALANLYTILDVSFQQLAVGLAILPSLVALTWYVSHPAHRRQLSAASCRAGARARLRSDRSPAQALSPRTEPAISVATRTRHRQRCHSQARRGLEAEACLE